MFIGSLTKCSHCCWGVYKIFDWSLNSDVIKSATPWVNQKQRMMTEFLKKLEIKGATLSWGDRAALRLARADLSWATLAFTQKNWKQFFDSRDIKCMWQGIQATTEYKTTSQVEPSDAFLAERLNEFYTRFKALNHTPGKKPPIDKQALHLSPADVREAFNTIIP